MAKQYFYFLMLFGLILGLHAARENQPMIREPASKASLRSPGGQQGEKIEIEETTVAKPALWVEPISTDQK